MGYLVASIVVVVAIQTYVVACAIIGNIQAQRATSRLDTLRIKVHDTLRFSPELNMANYTDEQVGNLNNAVTEACILLQDYKEGK